MNNNYNLNSFDDRLRLAYHLNLYNNSIQHAQSAHTLLTLQQYTCDYPQLIIRQSHLAAMKHIYCEQSNHQSYNPIDLNYALQLVNMKFS